MSTRLQAKISGGITEVKALITHPMETGARQNVKTGKNIPAHFIEEVKCEYNGKVVMSAIWSVGISTNPYTAFKFKGGAIGEKVKLSWKDNKDKTESLEVEIEESNK